MRTKRNYLLSFLTTGAIIGILFSWSCKKEDPVEGPATVTTSVVVEIGSVSAKGVGNVSDDGGITVTARGMVWSRSENPTLDDNEGFTEDGAGTGVFISDITNLTTETTYYVRAYATNSAGTAYGEQVSFVTIFISGEPYADPRDGNVYNTVQIGDQCWLKEDLRYLPQVSTSSAGSQTNPYYYVYDYQGTDVSGAIATDNYQNYGVLYNWSAAMNAASSSTANPSGVQGVCPTGWHLPSDAEWTQLTDYVGGLSGAGGKLKETGTTHWTSPNEGATNETGFTALPGGTRITNGYFYYIGYVGGWWSSTGYSSAGAYYRGMSYHNGNVGRFNDNKGSGFSVRCVRD